MSRARKPTLPPEFIERAEATNRIDCWDEIRAESQREASGIGAIFPGIYAAQPPEDFDPPKGYVSPRVERERARLLGKI